MPSPWEKGKKRGKQKDHDCPLQKEGGKITPWHPFPNEKKREKERLD